MATFNGKSSPQDKANGKNLKQNQLSAVSKKGKTLGAQHASHGDTGVESGKGRGAKTAKKSN